MAFKSDIRASAMEFPEQLKKKREERHAIEVMARKFYESLRDFDQLAVTADIGGLQSERP
jgi:hypothetical protein